MNNNSYAKIYASKVSPDPAMDVLWMDLAEDPKGSIIKFWNGDSYIPISLGNSGDLGNVLASITSEIAQAKSEAISQSNVYTDAEVLAINLNGYMTIEADNSNVGILRFNQSPPNSTLAAGEMKWDSSEGSLRLGMNAGSVSQSIGLEFMYRVSNNSSIDIVSGDLVSFSGSNPGGGTINVVKTIPGSNPNHIIGIAAENIFQGESGFVTWSGKIRGVQTDGSSVGEVWTPGSVLYPHPSISGKLTKNVPLTGNKTPIAYVIYSHSSNGSLFIRVQRGVSIQDISDVDVSAAQTGQPLVKASNGTWRPGNSINVDWISPSTGTLNVDRAISSAEINSGTINAGSIASDTSITSPGYKIPGKTNSDFIMANGETLPITTLKAGVYQLYNPSNNTQVVLEINAAGQVLINGDIIQNGAAYKIDAEEVTTKEQQITLRKDATTGMPIGDLAGFIIKLYDGVNDGMIVIDNAGVLRIGDVGDLQPVLTREEAPVDQSPLFYNTTTNRAETLPGTTVKTSLVDNDAVMVKDSIDTYKPKWWTFANIKANLKSYFDPIYIALTGNQTIAGVKTFYSLPKIPLTPLANEDAASKAYTDGVSNTTMSAAVAAKDLAQQYAENPEDVEVITGEYSAKHWAAKSEYYFDNLTQNWVGVVIDPTLSSSEPAPKSTVAAYRATELMRTGNLYYHKAGNSRIFNAFQLAIVNRATRKVAWYLNKNTPTLKADGTTSSPDWATQNIAVIVPDLYRRITVLDVETGKYEVAYDIMPFDGAVLWHEESAHSPGFASVDRTLTQLVSVVSDDVRFRGGNNPSANDLLPSTQLGRPATAISRINFENYAAASGWETGNIADRTMWHELTALYFANTNIQLAYTTTLTAEGYPQGGLGAGVTGWSSPRWTARNGLYPIHKVGEGFMTVGCNTGVKSMTDEKYYVGAISSVSAGNLVATGQFTTGAGWSDSYIGYTVQNLQTLEEATITGKTDDNTLTLSADIFTTAGQWYWIKGVTYSYEIPVFFGLEHLYGEIWDWVSGVNIDVSATVENGGTGESKAYVCTDFSKRAATITPDYTYIGLTPRADDYIKELHRDFAIAKVNTGASSTTFMSDRGYYANLPSSGSVVRGLLFGAYATYGVSAGVRSSHASYVPTTTTAYIGARLRAKIEK